MQEAGGAPLLLTAREAACGPALSVSSSPPAVATAAFGASRVAALFAPPDGARVQLGVFHVAVDGATSTARSDASALVDLLPKGELECREAEEGEEAVSLDCSKWSLAWSPDGSFLVVAGAAWRGRERGWQATVWVYACSRWMGMSPVSRVSEGLLLFAHPSDYVPAKRWKPSASIATVFFCKSRLFLLSHDAVLLAVDIQAPRLAILAADDGEPSKDEVKRIFKMGLAKNMTEWHAGVTAVCFDVPTSTLVVSGGVRSPSDDLIAANASSLSVWRVGERASGAETIELLDFTMVLNPSATKKDADAAPADAGQDPVKTRAAPSLLQPLKFMVGTGARKEKPNLPGSIRQLALATDGNYVVMLDADGKLAVRQIDACADVVAWQAFASLLAPEEMDEPRQQEVTCVSWLTNTRLALLLGNGKVVYAQLISSSSEEASQGIADCPNTGEDAGPNRSMSASLRRVAGYYYAPTLSASASEETWRVECMSCSSASDAAPTVCSAVVTQGDARIAAVFHQSGVSQFISQLVSAGQVDTALEIIERHGLDGKGVDIDALHRRVWTDFCTNAVTDPGSDSEDTKENALSPRSQVHDSATIFLQTRGLPADGSYSFARAIDHLARVKDQWWVLDECLRVAAANSFGDMKQILSTGQEAAESISSGSTKKELSEEVADEIAAKREQLLRYLYRLETLRIIVAEEEETAVAREGNASGSTLEADTLFNGPAFLWFASNPLLDTAMHLALEGRVIALTMLFRRHAWNLLPFRLQVLSKVPAMVPPVSYAHLLPALPSFAADTRFYSLPRLPHGLPVGSLYPESGDALDAAEIDLVPENESDDLTSDELALFESKAQQSSSDRGEEYAAWFQARILDMDGVQGQLDAAYQLSRLCWSCLSGWTASTDAKRELDEFLMAVERLYKCVYQFPHQLSGCIDLSLSEWITIPFYQQAMMVVGKIESASAAIERLRVVILAQRRDRLYALDELFSWIAQSVLFETPSLASLQVCAQVIQLSNSSLPLQDRWIQSDSHLLRTAIDVVFSSQISAVIGEANQHQPELRVQYTAVTELLWSIFQSLPVRKDDDPPDIAHLQVEVDEMEDLMVAMEVLAKYDILTTPSELKDVVSHEASGSHEVLERMCRRYLVPATEVASRAAALAPSEETASTNDGSEWMEVWQDAIKLKQHVFGERLVQEDILDTILRHLLSHESYATAAHDLAVNWILSNVEATDHVMSALMAQLQARLDSPCDFPSRDAQQATDGVSAKYVEILRAIAALPAVREWDPLRSERLEEFFQMEIDLVYASQLLSVMTGGAVAPLPSSIRVLTNPSDRLDLVVQVLTSNPSNYQSSEDTKRWLEAHQVSDEHLSIGDDTQPLSVVMYLAGLLQVEGFKQDITMKGAYASLYCSDFDVAYTLTMGVIRDEECGASNVGAGVPLLHILSLVLDLVSASSFRSWTKKMALCRSIFTMQASGPGTNEDLFSNQVADLLLLWLQKLEAIQDLALELGLSERSLEKRLADDTSSGGVEDILLKEVEVVIDLLQQEKRDRAFLLRLLQKGFHLLCVAVSFNPEASTSAGSMAISSDSEASRQFEGTIVRMARLCLNVGVDAALGSDLTDDGQYLELGLAYLLLWNDLHERDDDAVKTLWETELLPEVFGQVATTPSGDATTTSAPLSRKERVVRRLHHYFLFSAASMEVRAIPATSGDAESVWRAKRERLDTYASSYESLRGWMARSSTLLADEEDNAEGFQQDDSSAAVRSASRHKLFLDLAATCQAQLTSQQRSHEMEKVNALFHDALDVEAFAHDEQYRTRQILWLATKKEQFQAATQFADKYGVDPFQCVLAYIKSALLPGSTSALDAISRHEQLERAFQSDGADFLELALQRPAAFGDFLLRGERGSPSLYDSLAGSDHVGVLLALRMVLECAKRLSTAEQTAAGGLEGLVAEPSGAHSLFPLPKESVERVTLVFMCMKRLKEQLDARDDVPGEPVDLKRVCRAATSRELLSVAAADDLSALEARQAAVQAALPLLTAKSIKSVTKVLQKLHRAAASAVVMLYLNAQLAAIWAEHADATSDAALQAELAAYAYEACLPFLPVLSNEHLVLLALLLLGKPWRQAPMLRTLEPALEFYGQDVDAVARFAPLLAADKRVEVASDALRLLRARFEAFRASAAEDASRLAALERKTRELEALQSELVEACVRMALDAVKQADSSHRAALEDVEAAWGHWRALDEDARQRESRAYVERLVRLLFQGGGRSAGASVRARVLIAELLFLLAEASDEDAAAVLAQCVRAAVVHTAREELALGAAASGEQWPDRLARQWATRAPSAAALDLDAHESVARLSRYLSAFTRTQRASRDGADAAYDRLVQRLGELPSPLLRAVAGSQSLRLERAAASAAVAAWSDLVAECEARGLWASAAVASRVLLGATAGAAASPEAATATATSRTELARRHFGLQTRAAWHALVAQHVARPGDDAAAAAMEPSLVFDGPASAVAERFHDVLDVLLRAVETRDGAQPSAAAFALAATRALANLLAYRSATRALGGRDGDEDGDEDGDGDGDGDAKPSAARQWAEEQRRAVAARVAAQFGLEPEPQPDKQAGDERDDQGDRDDESRRLWSALLLRGAWPSGERECELVDWFEQRAFEHVGGAADGADAVEQFATARWETHRMPALLLLLMSPSDDLRARWEARILEAAASALTILPVSPPTTALLELLLLRVDMATLRRARGLYAPLVARLAPPSASPQARRCRRRWPRAWTSSGEYAICALVASGESAAAGRLACALGGVHPMLWDFESAQLALGNLVRVMAAARGRRSRPADIGAAVRRQIVDVTRARLEREQRL